MASRSDERLQQLLARARESGVPVRGVSDAEIARESRGGVHQGVVATIDDGPAYSVEELVRVAEGVPLIVVLDGIEDPHNLGAILRTADAAGAHGVVIQNRRSAALAGAAAKASAGAMAHVRIAEVVNIARAIEELKEAGVWTIGLAGEATIPYDSVDMTGPTALVVGAEGVGLRRLVRESCDFLVANSHAWPCRQPERVGRGGGGPVRGRAAAVGRGETAKLSPASRSRPLTRLAPIAPVAREVLPCALCLAGVAQSGRAADL